MVLHKATDAGGHGACLVLHKATAAGGHGACPVLHKATVAGGHGACPAMKPLPKKCIWKGGHPPKVARKPAGKKQSCFGVANAPPPLSQGSGAAGSADFQFDASSITVQQRHVWKQALKLPIGHDGSPPPEVRETMRKGSNAQDACGDCEPFCS